jgi:ribosomal protein L20A (L18A)|tara:strand:- start:9366 stop:9515 length:150 start_codon:yes stop_codon:yes gene_type:complete
MPALAKDKLDKELKKEKKRFTKEIRANKKAKIHDSTYKVRRSKFQNTSY